MGCDTPCYLPLTYRGEQVWYPEYHFTMAHAVRLSTVWIGSLTTLVEQSTASLLQAVVSTPQDYMGSPTTHDGVG